MPTLFKSVLGFLEKERKDKKNCEKMKIEKKKRILDKYIDIVASLYIMGAIPPSTFDVPMLVTDCIHLEIGGVGVGKDD